MDFELGYEEMKPKAVLTHKPESAILPSVINKIKKDKKMTNTTKELKTKKTDVLDTMSSLSILWYLIIRHKFFLVCTGWAITITWVLITQLPASAHNIMR